MLKKSISSILISSILVGTSGGINVFASEIIPSQPITLSCYPAYTCMNKGSIPTEYRLIASNANRNLGALVGTSIVGAIGLIPGLGLASFLASVGIGYNEYKNGYSSYLVYIKRHPDTNKKAYLKTVYYRYPNFTGDVKTVITTF
ncbi:hypothetical protein [Clostridium perfringens]|uniref:hypothetical protein n=1 Tax=Clostridium perfringens TaxID=1502 RepID=UPI0022481740|nr:hypothetical protein [Clostridium perfringens]MCX0368600.1 hypothetical protein [Clostridium perfringens]